MRIGITILIILIQFTLPAQTTKGIKIRCKTDKQTYAVGEHIHFKATSWQNFRIPTDGDCSSAPLYPVLVKEVNDKYPFPPSEGVLACGLPFTSPLRKFKTTLTAESAGKYKILFYSDRGNIFSETIIIK